MNSSTIIVFYRNHFDLLWRRCWQRSYEYEGLTYRGYADLWDAWITRALRLTTDEGAAFELEQALSVREYLRRHPAALPVLRRLVSDGRFELLGAGEAIIDVNLCQGETMVRNLASGVCFARDVLGQQVRWAYHGDGFGSSAQFPQVARLCGLRGIDGLSYCRPETPYWRGLDGSTVFTAFNFPGRDYFYAHCFYEPCLVCCGQGSLHGVSCLKCEGTGLRLEQGYFPPREWVAEPVPELGRYIVTSEEQMPDENLPKMICERPATSSERYVWGTQTRLFPLWEADLECVDDAGISVSPRIENNPVMTGCYVSRIRSKQTARFAEAWFYAVEKLAATGFLAGYPHHIETMTETWQMLPLIFFHDAVTGTHNDPAHAELFDMSSSVANRSRALTCAIMADRTPGAAPVGTWRGDGAIMVFNPHPFETDLDVEISVSDPAYRAIDAKGFAQPVYHQPSDAEVPASHEECIGPGYWNRRGELPPRTFRFLAQGIPPLGTGVYRIQCTPEVAVHTPENHACLDDIEMSWNDQGVHSLRFSGREILDGTKGPAGFLLVEKDEGDPWGTRSLDKARVSCAQACKLLCARRTGDVVEVVFAGEFANGSFGRETDPRVFALYWRQTVRMLRGLPWVEFDYDLFWQAADRRIRICFPSRSIVDRGLYEVPFGVLERERYEQTETYLWSGTGDWPSTGFTATLPHTNTPGLAVLNQGTPSMRIEDGILMCSVLRSPRFYQGLLRTAQEYPMPLDGMRDGGRHQFRFALLPHVGDDCAKLLRVSSRFNAATPLVRVPIQSTAWASGIAVDEPGVEIAAIKQSFSGRGLALRLIERIGQARTVAISVPDCIRRVSLCNLIEERETELPVHDGKIRVPLRAYGIHTLLLEIENDQ